MKHIMGGRRSGKSTKAMKEAKEKNGVLLVPNLPLARRLNEDFETTLACSPSQLLDDRSHNYRLRGRIPSSTLTPLIIDEEQSLVQFFKKLGFDLQTMYSTPYEAIETLKPSDYLLKEEKYFKELEDGYWEKQILGNLINTTKEKELEEEIAELKSTIHELEAQVAELEYYGADPEV